MSREFLRWQELRITSRRGAIRGVARGSRLQEIRQRGHRAMRLFAPATPAQRRRRLAFCPAVVVRRDSRQAPALRRRLALYASPWPMSSQRCSFSCLQQHRRRWPLPPCNQAIRNSDFSLRSRRVRLPPCPFRIRPTRCARTMPTKSMPRGTQRRAFAAR